MAEVFRITRKQASKLVPILNKKGVFVENVASYLDKEDIKRAAGITKANGCSSVYVSEERDGRQPHHTIHYNESYQRTWGDQPLYGNIICVIGDKAYAELPDALKIPDAELNNITL
jgi:hypothetical protein